MKVQITNSKQKEREVTFDRTFSGRIWLHVIKSKLMKMIKTTVIHWKKYPGCNTLNMISRKKMFRKPLKKNRGQIRGYISYPITPNLLTIFLSEPAIDRSSRLYISSRRLPISTSLLRENGYHTCRCAQTTILKKPLLQASLTVHIKHRL